MTLFKSCHQKYDLLKAIFEIIGIIIWCIFIPIYILIPMYPHFVLKRIYYSKFLPEIKNKCNNNLIYLSILLGKEVFSLVFMVTFFIMHYIFEVICLPIHFLVIFIIYKINKINIC